MNAKRGVQILLVIPVLIVVCLVDLPAQAKYSGGTGEQNDPYQIATAADLIALGEDPNDFGKQFLLTSDIDLDPNLPGRKVFDKAVIAPDVNDMNGTPFTGVFDGNSHTISHLVVRGDSYLGLFGSLYPRAKVKDLGVVDVSVAGSGRCVAGLVGGNWLGTVTQCYSTGVVSGERDVGGLVGWNYWGGTVSQCYSTSAVSGTDYFVGGLVGHNWQGTITQCYSTGVVSGNYYVGGLVGWNWSAGVTQCYSTGVVSGTCDVGGLAGGNFDGIVTQCYSTGVVSGYESVGGLVGENDGILSGPRDVAVSFWDTQTSGQVTSAGGIGKTTSEMQTANTFLNAGWDFVGEATNGPKDIWWINEGKDYPRLIWHGPAGIVFVDIPAGMFQMGDHDGVGDFDERPVHTVMLDDFQISKYETTNAQYAVYLNAVLVGGLIQVVNGVVYASSDSSRSQPYCDTHGSDSYSQIEYSQSRFTILSRDGKAMDDHPMVRVSWYGAKAFCDYYGYCLPTEAEWEYAARGGYHDPYYRYPWGNNVIDCSKANYYICNPLNLTSYPYTSPVGYYGARGAYGLCDMSGNVWEWCQDGYDSGYYSASPASNPTGSAVGTYCVLRGGSWGDFDKLCRVANRNWYKSVIRINSLGFRVCR